ncbi:DNA mismatch repair protein MutS [Ochrobactrum sp. RH2CCR150]|uniref:MutS-related protein n=1 Tax=Ochrobactrum sp. RH2CCR150 TaxID=2587044 RepID=UPI0015FB3AF7|nr:DNA mismatch repair ATPase MutS [Ochrobactrum sp. RH2CCR150]
MNVSTIKAAKPGRKRSPSVVPSEIPPKDDKQSGSKRDVADGLLFQRQADPNQEDGVPEPDFFHDLNLDQLFLNIHTTRQEYELQSFFRIPLREREAVIFRQEIMRDLEKPEIRGIIDSFSQYMRDVRAYQAMVEKMYYEHQKNAWTLDLVSAYCKAVQSFAEKFEGTDIASRGLRAFGFYLAEYSADPSFTALAEEGSSIKQDLATVKYSVTIKAGTVTVQKYDDEPDYTQEVQATFEKFRQGAVKDYRIEIKDNDMMNSVEERILGLVAILYKDIFSHLSRFCTQNADCISERIKAFDREVQFYTGYLDYIDPLRKAGLEFCYPVVSETSKAVLVDDCFDLLLAQKLTGQKTPVVTNSFQLSGKERIFIVSGPNQGGKTTFARTFGQLHYLASLGLPVPGKKAELFLPDRIFTHFEKEESPDSLRGKLEDDLFRIHAILQKATPDSIVIMNEIFNSTMLRDEIFLSKQVLKHMEELDLLCVCVTFIDELASLSEKTVGMVSTVNPDNPAERTYKLVRAKGNGLAYALSIAEKYGLTYNQLKTRMKP